MTQSFERGDKRPARLKQSDIYGIFSLPKFSVCENALKGKNDACFPGGERLSCRDRLLCNKDFKSMCSSEATFQRLSPPARQELMTANNAFFFLFPHKCLI